MALPQPLYYLDTESTPGSSFSTVLESAYPEEARLPANTIEDLTCLRREQINAYSFFAGPFGTGLFGLLDRPVSCATLLRDPFDRTVSQIRFWQRRLRSKTVWSKMWSMVAGDSERLLRLQKGDIGDVLADPVLAALLADLQTRYLGVEVDLNPLLGLDVPVSSMARLFEVHPDRGRMQEVAASARRRLDAMDFVGIAEASRASVFLLWEQLGVESPATLPSQGLPPAWEDLDRLSERRDGGHSATVIERIDALTAFDRETYQHARSLYQKRVASWEARAGRPLPSALPEQPRRTAPPPVPRPLRPTARPVSEPPPIYFAHIPKTAGTSFADVLRSGYPKHMRLWAYSNSHLLALEREEINRYRCYIGHFGTGLLSLLDKEVASVTMLRDPFERTISQIRYWRHDRGLRRLTSLTGGSVERALRLRSGDVREALDDPDVTAQLQDFQTRNLGISLDLERFRGCDPGELDTLLRTAAAGVPIEEVADAARRRLDAMDVVGITEDFEASARLLEQFLRLPHAADRTPRRVSLERQEPGSTSYRESGEFSPDIIERIDAITVHDRQIYTHARALFDKRRKAGPSDPMSVLEPTESRPPELLNIG